MAKQTNPDDKMLIFGRTQPTRPFDGEPTIIIFDLNNHIVDPHIDLRPFNDIVFITTDENALRDRLTDSIKSFTIASIHPQWNHLQTEGFVQQNLVIYDTVGSIYLFYVNAHLNNISGLFGNRIVDCFPITTRFLTQIREICSKTNDLNIAYCEHQRVQNERQKDIGVANLYATQLDNRLAIQISYNKLIERQLEDLAL